MNHTSVTVSVSRQYKVMKLECFVNPALGTLIRRGGLASAGCNVHLRRWPPSTMLTSACFGRLATGRFAQRPPRSGAAEARADATVLLECLNGELMISNFLALRGGRV